MISVTSLDPEDTLRIQDWPLIDTNNIYLNDRLVVINDFDSYSNDNFSYIILKFVKSNKGGSKRENPDEHVLIDYNKNLFYLLDQKLCYKLNGHQDMDVPSKLKDTLISQKFNFESDDVKIIFNSSIPSPIRGKYVNSKNNYGVSNILSPYQKMDLIEWRESSQFNLDSIADIAKKECKLQSGNIDLLFFSRNK